VKLFRLVDLGLRTAGSDCTLLVASTAGARMCLSHHTRHILERQLPHFAFIALFYMHFEISSISRRITSWKRVVRDKLILAQLENPPHFMQPEGLTVTTTTGTGPYSESDQSNPLRPILYPEDP